jgi:hypothetical protein
MPAQSGRSCRCPRRGDGPQREAGCTQPETCCHCAVATQQSLVADETPVFAFWTNRREGRTLLASRAGPRTSSHKPLQSYSGLPTRSSTAKSRIRGASTRCVRRESTAAIKPPPFGCHGRASFGCRAMSWSSNTAVILRSARRSICRSKSLRLSDCRSGTTPRANAEPSYSSSCLRWAAQSPMVSSRTNVTIRLTLYAAILPSST